MNKKKTPDQTAQSHNTQANHSIPPRMMRLALALLERPAGVPRELADKIAPASNGPHYIGKLRSRFDIEIPCDRVNCTTADGEASWYGLYILTPSDRRILLEALQ